MFRRNLICENLSYSINDKNLLNNLSFSLGKEKTGLVGINGIGKTTLIRLLVGELKPTTGTIYLDGKIGYLPQNFIVDEDQTIASVFGIEEKIKALEKINSGCGTMQDYETVGDDWNIIEKTKELLLRCNLANLNLSRELKTLSGGQITRVFFAKLLISGADFLILDEPTNNLDYESRFALYEIIKNFDGGLLTVSHDRQLLSLMDNIIELTSLGLKTYGGNFTDFLEQKRIEQKALKQDIIDAKKSLNKTKKVTQQSKERYEQRAKIGKKARATNSQPKMFLDYQKNRAEKTKSKLEEKTDKMLEYVQNKLNTAKSKIEQKDFLNFDLEATRVHNTKKIIEIKNLDFAYSNNSACIKNFNMALIGPKRIAISGKNGSGKTTLFKLITKQLEPTSGQIEIGVENVAYIDQSLSILDPEQTVLENFKRLNPTTKETDCRLRLATFLFSNDEAFKIFKNLSGGEKMRATLACVLMGDAPPQLILLDEPTNNMDLESIESIETALQNYKGALILVSHDETFLKNIGIEEKINLPKLY